VKGQLFASQSFAMPDNSGPDHLIGGHAFGTALFVFTCLVKLGSASSLIKAAFRNNLSISEYSRLFL
jgi:hypothetical protein